MGKDSFVTVVGAGLAGSECALQLARRGVRVRLCEQRPLATTEAHHTDGLAELVCSNSLKATRRDSAAGLLKAELELMGSELLACAREAAVPAGGALAVDRERFSALVSERVAAEPNIELVRGEVTEVPEGQVVIAAGPLCSDALAARISDLVGAGRVVAKDFEQRDLFCACQPVEEVARTGLDAARYGAMKPVGLVDPRSGRRPWAVVQLRPENAAHTAYNLVGFQTNLTWPEQRRVFRMIPGLEGVEFFRYGVMHRNSFVDAPRVLDDTFAVPGTQVRLAGQICGTEGYTEAMASGLLAALNTFADVSGLTRVHLPETGALGSLVAYATNSETSPYQPMHVNFGIVPPLGGPRLKKRERYAAYADRALADLAAYVAERGDLFGER